MPKTEQLQRQLDELWTMTDVCKVLGRTSMTIHNWRRDRKLPAVEVQGHKRPAIRFVPADVLEWARQHGIETRPLVKRRRVRSGDHFHTAI